MVKKSFNKKEKGQGLVEYALIMVLVGVVVIAVLMVVGPQIGNIFSRVNSSLSIAGANNSGAAAAPVGSCSSSLAKWQATVGAAQDAMGAAGWPSSGPVHDNWVSATNEWQNSPERTYWFSNGC
ncbi:MAG: hypothetical protein U0V02_17995 [Anaerolineales bacterium]